MHKTMCFIGGFKLGFHHHHRASIRMPAVRSPRVSSSNGFICQNNDFFIKVEKRNETKHTWVFKSVLPPHAKVRNKGVQSLNKEWTRSQLVRRRKGSDGGDDRNVKTKGNKDLCYNYHDLDDWESTPTHCSLGWFLGASWIKNCAALLLKRGNSHNIWKMHKPRNIRMYKTVHMH